MKKEMNKKKPRRRRETFEQETSNKPLLLSMALYGFPSGRPSLPPPLLPFPPARGQACTFANPFGVNANPIWGQDRLPAVSIGERQWGDPGPTAKHAIAVLLRLSSVVQLSSTWAHPSGSALGVIFSH